MVMHFKLTSFLLLVSWVILASLSCHVHAKPSSTHKRQTKTSSSSKSSPKTSSKSSLKSSPKSSFKSSKKSSPKSSSKSSFKSSSDDSSSTDSSSSSSSSSSSGSSLRNKTPSDYLVSKDALQKINPLFSTYDGDLYSGLVPFQSHHHDQQRSGELMFWLFIPTIQQVPDSMVLWLNGGPGCSSFDAGAFMETAPITIPQQPAGYLGTHLDDPLTENIHSWTKMTTMLYVEQPAGTGFSTGPTPDSEDDVAHDMHSFLENLFNIFNSFPLPAIATTTSTTTTLKNLRLYDFFIFGESYAGYYVPSIARRIYLENEKIQFNNKNKNRNDNDDDEKNNHNNKNGIIRLTGIALGNGWTEAATQGPAVIDYAWWHGMIDTYTRRQLHHVWKKCYQSSIGHNEEEFDEPLHPFTIPDECGIMEVLLRAAGKGLIPNRAPNTYDVTTWDTYPVLDTENPGTTMTHFFNTPEVKEAIHAPLDKTWRGCIPGAGRRRRRRLHEDDTTVAQARSPQELEDMLRRHGSSHHRQLHLLDDDTPDSTAPYMATLMDEAGIRVLVYNGDRDLSTNSAGTEQVLDRMVEWSGNQDWISGKATRGLWTTRPDDVKMSPKKHHNDDDDEEEKEDDNRAEFSGWVKTYQHLTFLVIYNSGHLVPYNQPGPSLDLLHRFLSNKSFIDKVIPDFFSEHPIHFDQSDDDSQNDDDEDDEEMWLDHGNNKGTGGVGLSHSGHGGGWSSFVLGLLVGGLGVAAISYHCQQRSKYSQYETIPTTASGRARVL